MFTTCTKRFVNKRLGVLAKFRNEFADFVFGDCEEATGQVTFTVPLPQGYSCIGTVQNFNAGCFAATLAVKVAQVFLVKFDHNNLDFLGKMTTITYRARAFCRVIGRHLVDCLALFLLVQLNP